MSIKTLWTSLPRAARIYLTAVGALSIAAFATVVTVAATSTPLLAAAPSPSPSASTGQAYCNRFTQHVASNLGKSQSQVQKAISDAINQTIDDAVKNGDLTQSQANAIKAKTGAQAGQSCAAGKIIPGVIGGRGGFHGGFPRPGMPGMNPMNETAKALGISTSELQQDLRSGQTLQAIAASKGMDEAAFRSKLVSVTKADLDQQVTAGKLTQNQENAILQRLQNDPLPFWSRAPRQPKAAAPTPTPTP